MQHGLSRAPDNQTAPPSRERFAAGTPAGGGSDGDPPTAPLPPVTEAGVPAAAALAESRLLAERFADRFAELNRFLQCRSVRPGSSFAISTQRVPDTQRRQCETAAQRERTSASGRAHRAGRVRL